MKYVLHKKKLSRRRIVGTRTLGTTGLIVGAIIFGAGVLTSTPILRQSSSAQQAILPVAQAAETEKSPWRIRIPSLGLDAPIQKVGLTRTGSMGVPSKYDEVGWLKTSAQPGQAGNAVIAGHLNGGRNVSAVFENLHKLQVGDYIHITDDNSSQELQFRVTGIGSYKPENTPYEKIFGDTAQKHLNLITCSGTWNKTKQDYTERRIVFSQLVD